MIEPLATQQQEDPLATFMTQQRARLPLVSGDEWATLQTVDALQEKFAAFMAGLDDDGQQEYVRLQRALIEAQAQVERNIRQFVTNFEHQSLERLRTGLKDLTGHVVDPKAQHITTTYSYDRFNEPKVVRLSLWDAACMNYDGLTGWDYPGHDGVATSSGLSIDLSPESFIALVRELNLGGQLRTLLDDSLDKAKPLGQAIVSLGRLEFEFALIEALRDSNTTRIDREKYRHIKQALDQDEEWGRCEEMQLFIPDGKDNIGWVPQFIGNTGQILSRPPGDSLNIPHLVFSVNGCKGAFSYFPRRPGGGDLRHFDNHREACQEFYVAFSAFYRQGRVAWLYGVMSQPDSERLTRLRRGATRETGLSPFAEALQDLFLKVFESRLEDRTGYTRKVVTKAPPVSLGDLHLARIGANLKGLANEKPGFLTTLAGIARTVISEVLELLLMPVPGPLKGLARVRAVALFAALGEGVLNGISSVLEGHAGELVLAFSDLADLLISGRLHSRLAFSVRRRHQALYQRLSQIPAASIKDSTGLSSPQLLERMLLPSQAPAHELQAVLETSGTSREQLERVWAGERPSASLVEAAHRFNADRMIDWVAGLVDSNRPVPMGAFEVLGPLLTQLPAWPLDTALRIVNAQGQELRRYSRDTARPTTVVITVTALENHRFGYSTPQRITAHLSHAVVQLLPSSFSAGEQAVRRQLAAQAQASRFDLFEALTRFADIHRSAATRASVSVRKWLPDSVGHDYPVPEVIEVLRALHPDVSLPRLLEVLDQHPLSPDQQARLLEVRQQPEGLYDGLKAAAQMARAEALIDRIYHRRRFDPQTQAWVQAFARSALGTLGKRLIVGPPTYVPLDRDRYAVLVLDHGEGEFSPYDPCRQSAGVQQGGADAFFRVMLSQLSDHDRARFGADMPAAITGFRHQVAQAMLRNRAPQGTFYPVLREITQYASDVDATRMASEPDAMGLYRLASDRYLFIDSQYFKVTQADQTQPWRIRHPALDDAYAPVLSHNGAGAWRHEWENPLTWDGQQPFYRLGPRFRALAPDAIDKVQQISGVTPDILRKVHVRSEPPPVLLVEAFERLNIFERVKDGLEQGAEFIVQVLDEITPDAADALVGRAGVAREDQVTTLESKVHMDKLQMHAQFFDVLRRKNQRSDDPSVQVIVRQFPGLTVGIAQDWVQHASASELERLREGRVPHTLAQEARWWSRWLRVCGALEGVHLSPLANDDSSRLILHELAGLKGWPASLRVELWDARRVIDSVGPDDADLRRVLKPSVGQYLAYVQRADGSLQAMGARAPFLEALLNALPLAERQALGYTHPGALEELRAEMGARLGQDWSGIQATLNMRPMPSRLAPPRLINGRKGYPLSGGTEFGPTEREQISRMRELYPSKTDAEVWAMLAEAGDTVAMREEMITKQVKERDQLYRDLQAWRDQASTAQPDSASARSRALAVERIQRCWAKEAVTPGVAEKLNLDDLDLASLPTLRAHFGHVTMLSVRNNRLTELPERFLFNFPALRVLYLNGNQLTHLPNLDLHARLAVLNLSNNHLRFNYVDEERLAELTELRSLDLSGNPLGQGRRLNVYRLTNLRELNLRNCALNQLPRGAVSLSTLGSFDLRDNQIQDLAETDLFIYPEVHQGMNLRGNPLSAEARQLLRRVGERRGPPGVNFGLWEPTVPFDRRPDRWLALLPPGEVQARQLDWAYLQNQPMADYFFELLASIAEYPQFIDPHHRVMREIISHRVWGVIDDAMSHEGMERIAYLPCYRTLRGGIDGCLLCLHQLELQIAPLRILDAGVQTAGPNLLHYYRALRRLEYIDQYLSRHFEPQGMAFACTRVLSYRIALASSLNLPQVLPQRFEAAVPDARSVNTVRTAVLNNETGTNWPELLQKEPFWVHFIQHKYAADLEFKLRRFQKLLEVADQQLASGLISEGQYVNRLNGVRDARASAENKRIRDFTHQEWTAFVIG
ncbi:NEL-type E3 ubiquitin ligase domain-containing protein [Pseudomonas sp. NFPP24]|uniref:NEL-type E3 ubiquitin ligase domain-containing protein n=1 Tax=Pseudomonas sp. NFPP24 TaxID=1566228 RepID=UPI0008F34A0F|nr:NEL-type E3 ubiquitin ligase domain-containing protein [Pseudomonas sp. NFPP24]SFB18593.1 Leucine rich repeat-containing protein [Pseudomonas sp. NFPP24]